MLDYADIWDDGPDEELRASLQRLHEYVEDRFARGNKPDFESARKHALEFERLCAEDGPSGMTDGLTEDEISELAVAMVKDVRRRYAEYQERKANEKANQP
ncbi:MAG: hypothetical protein JO164_09650 [Candidatus Eremiobacteraeota bacterium]|nr:hypothetical protein [Candidatus Eremiobacteraeota bacterium]